MGSDCPAAGWCPSDDGFNPHSRMGSDQSVEAQTKSQMGFNPHSRMGSDIIRCTFDVVDIVSIHTPAWGVTEHQHLILLRTLFQSTLPHGE